MYCATCRDWANFYPRYPSEEDLIHYTQDSEIFQQHRVLAMFAMDYQQLYWGGVLLPDLIRFYQWLHTSLAYSLTHEVATYAEIGEVVERAEKEHGEHIRKLYDRVKQNFNRYIEVTGGDIVADSRTIVRVESISNVTRLVNFLTGNFTYRRNHYCDSIISIFRFRECKRKLSIFGSS